MAAVGKGKEEGDNGSDKEEEEAAGSSGPVDMLRKYLAEKLGLYETEEPKPEKPKVLDDVTLEGIAKYINDGKCKNIITMAGAGISTSAGIPDFRSPGSGIYDNLKSFNLPDPQAIFEISYFQQNPQPFFVLAKELFPGAFRPTPCHYFIRLLQEKGLLLRHYTQNIDTLERIAGVTGEKIVEAHGTFHTSHCLDRHCNTEYSLQWMKERIFSDSVPTCEKCNSTVKPDIVFFGENLPFRFFKLMKEDFPKCDLLIIMGTSLLVQPFASLVDRVEDKCPRLLINKEKAGQMDPIMRLLGGTVGLDFEAEDNYRDVAYLGTCDVGCHALAEALGWGAELRKMIDQEHKQLEEMEKKEKDKQRKESSSQGLKEKEKADGKESSSQRLNEKEEADGKESSNQGLKEKEKADGKESSSQRLKEKEEAEGEESSSQGLKEKEETDGKESSSQGLKEKEKADGEEGQKMKQSL